MRAEYGIDVTRDPAAGTIENNRLILSVVSGLCVCARVWNANQHFIDNSGIRGMRSRDSNGQFI